MVNKQTTSVILKIINDYDYIYNVIDYDCNASGNGYYDYYYLRSCIRLQLIMITNSNYPHA